ncbi:YbjN domain-containing protein [Streptomyces sp. DT225]
MSIDPSSIPNFGAQPEPQAAGPEGPVFSVRTFYDRPHATDQRPVLLDAIDDWNRRTLWPKVYTHTHEPEEGAEEGGPSVRLIGEAQMLIGTGVSLEHFVSSTVSWVRASIEFDKWLLERLGLAPAEQKSEDGTEQSAPDA